MVLASLLGLLGSFLSISLLRPALPPPWRWLGRGVVLHVGVWLVLHGLLTLVLSRPWFALAIANALVMLVVQVSNAKYHSLREAFVFQDFEYFTDAIRHPRLYIPFLGWWKFLIIALGVVMALVVGVWLEKPQSSESMVSLGLVTLGVSLLLFFRQSGELSWLPATDMARLGLIGSLREYALAERDVLELPQPRWAKLAGPQARPDLVVVQSESFFDPREICAGIREEVLAEFDQLDSEAWFSGPLSVPAWGANTVRSEFAFLSGANESLLGVHRFNPYRQICRAKITTLASHLRASGYRTVCIHPYPASFYRRERVFPHLGFDEFIDIQEFSGAERFGPYVSDAAVTSKVRQVLAEADQPLFIFVITMENHGPLHLESPAPGDAAALYVTPPRTDAKT